MSDIMERLRLDAAQFAHGGNMVHRSYYQRDVTEAADEIERLTRERNALKLSVRQLEEFIGRREDDILSISRERDALKAANGRLREVLRPFSDVAESDIGQDEADVDLFRPTCAKYARARLLLVGDLRAAHAALNHDGELE